MMATPAQISANRRNAKKSTGPKTPAGKHASSDNSRRHGLTSEVPMRDVFAAYDRIVGRPLSDGGEIDGVVLRLATAEARLARAREGERDLLSKGDDDIRMIPEIDHIENVVLEEYLLSGANSGETIEQALRLKLRIMTVGARGTRQSYARMLRYLREAERAHAAALSDWLDTK